MQRGCSKHFEVARSLLGNLRSLGNLSRTFASAINSLISLISLNSLKTLRHATIGQNISPQVRIRLHCPIEWHLPLGILPHKYELASKSKTKVDPIHHTQAITKVPVSKYRACDVG